MGTLILSVVGKELLKSVGVIKREKGHSHGAAAAWKKKKESIEPLAVEESHGSTVSSCEVKLPKGCSDNTSGERGKESREPESNERQRGIM